MLRGTVHICTLHVYFFGEFLLVIFVGEPGFLKIWVMAWETARVEPGCISACFRVQKMVTCSWGWLSESTESSESESSESAAAAAAAALLQQMSVFWLMMIIKMTITERTLISVLPASPIMLVGPLITFIVHETSKEGPNILEVWSQSQTDYGHTTQQLQTIGSTILGPRCVFMGLFSFEKPTSI